MSVIHVKKDTFDSDVLQADKPVLADFWAAWCGPCQMIGPLLEELSEEMPEIQLAKINIDEEPELAGRYQVESIPTLILFENGREVRRQTGAIPKTEIRQFIEG